MPITVYVIKSERNGKRYVGITNDLARRLREHAARKSKAGQLLSDVRLIHSEQSPDYASARAREKFLKAGQGREWLDELEKDSRPACGG